MSSKLTMSLWWWRETKQSKRSVSQTVFQKHPHNVWTGWTCEPCFILKTTLQYCLMWKRTHLYPKTIRKPCLSKLASCSLNTSSRRQWDLWWNADFVMSDLAATQTSNQLSPPVCLIIYKRITIWQLHAIGWCYIMSIDCMTTGFIDRNHLTKQKTFKYLFVTVTEYICCPQSSTFGSIWLFIDLWSTVVSCQHLIRTS